MGHRRERRLIIGITWVNCGWQIVFALVWNLGLRVCAEARWGEPAAALVQGVACLAPTALASWVVFGWMRRIGIWR